MTHSPNKFMRTRILQNLGDESSAKLAIEAVEVAFGLLWLEGDAGHRLQRVWQREDRLATVELFVLGSAIRKLQTTHPDWLKRTARKIRKDPSGHGWLTEIVAYGHMNPVAGVLLPAAVNRPGYDFCAEFDDGKRDFISVKNHDISSFEVEFQSSAGELRAAWRDRLQEQNANKSLVAAATAPMTKGDFASGRSFFSTLQLQDDQSDSHPLPHVTLCIRPLPNASTTLAAGHVSDSVLVVAPSPASEQERFEKNIFSAASKLKKHVRREPSSTSVIYMRVHVSADLDFLTAIADKMLTSEDCGFDAIIFYQPAYVRDEKGDSLLHSAFRISCGVRFIRSLGATSRYAFSIPIGSVSLSPSRVKPASADLSKAFVGAGIYFYQRGDIYKKASRDEHSTRVSLSSLAPGIREHGVADVMGREYVFSSKVTAESDALLIV